MNNANNNFVDAKSCESDTDESIASYATANEGENREIRCAPLLPHELQSLEKKLNQIIFVQQTDHSYHKALEDIRDQLEISVLVEPSFYGRHCITSVLVIATANNTYIFDLKALGRIFKPLAMLLESEVPRKIMHYSHRICDLLLYKHNVQINGVCDTLVALCVARQDRKDCSLRAAISLVLKIPLSELTCDEIEGPSESRRNFAARPLSQGQFQYLAKLAILQHKLYDRLMYGNICRELQQFTSKFSVEFSKNKNSLDVALNMGPGSKAGFNSIDPFYSVSPDVDYL